MKAASKTVEEVLAGEADRMAAVVPSPSNAGAPAAPPKTKVSLTKRKAAPATKPKKGGLRASQTPPRRQGRTNWFAVTVAATILPHRSRSGATPAAAPASSSATEAVRPAVETRQGAPIKRCSEEY